MKDISGSAFIGLSPWTGEHLKTTGLNIPSIVYLRGNPDTNVIGNAGSDVAIDATAGKIYICKSGTDLSTWYNLGSTT